MGRLRVGFASHTQGASCRINSMTEAILALKSLAKRQDERKFLAGFETEKAEHDRQQRLGRPSQDGLAQREKAEAAAANAERTAAVLGKWQTERGGQGR